MPLQGRKGAYFISQLERTYTTGWTVDFENTPRFHTNQRSIMRDYYEGNPSRYVPHHQVAMTGYTENCIPVNHLREITEIWQKANPFQSPTNGEEAFVTGKNPSLPFRYDHLLPLKREVPPPQRM